MNVDDTGRDEEDIVLWLQRHLDDDHDVDDDENHDDYDISVDDIEEPSWLLQWSAGGACTVGGTGEDAP